MICGKFREEMWEKKKRNLGEFSEQFVPGSNSHTHFRHPRLLKRHVSYSVHESGGKYSQRLV